MMHVYKDGMSMLHVYKGTRQVQCEKHALVVL
jgi:hypothetical protein